MTIEEDIKITAHIAPKRPNVCRFTVDRPVYEENSAYFWNRDTAKDSPLALKLFDLPGVTAVRLAGHDVTITRDSSADWRSFAGTAGDVLRGHIRSGEPAVSSAFRTDMRAEAEIKNKVQLLFDTEINPAVASHGGRIELMDVKDNKVFLKMSGGCQGCGSAEATLKQGIETSIRDRLPEIDEIIDVTDHASGASPYYAPRE